LPFVPDSSRYNLTANVRLPAASVSAAVFPVFAGVVSSAANTMPAHANKPIPIMLIRFMETPLSSVHGETSVEAEMFPTIFGDACKTPASAGFRFQEGATSCGSS
jgi:hypothetical protein